jgi:hypothetical protein
VSYHNLALTIPRVGNIAYSLIVKTTSDEVFHVLFLSLDDMYLFICLSLAFEFIKHMVILCSKWPLAFLEDDNEFPLATLDGEHSTPSNALLCQYCSGVVG